MFFFFILFLRHFGAHCSAWRVQGMHCVRIYSNSIWIYLYIYIHYIAVSNWIRFSPTGNKYIWTYSIRVVLGPSEAIFLDGSALSHAQCTSTHTGAAQTQNQPSDCGRFWFPVSSVWTVRRDFFRFKNKWTFRPWNVELFYQNIICSVFECRFCFTVLVFQFGLWSCSHTVDATQISKHGICVLKALRCSPGPQSSTEHTLTHNGRRPIKFLFKRYGNVNETNS